VHAGYMLAYTGVYGEGKLYSSTLALRYSHLNSGEA